MQGWVAPVDARRYLDNGAADIIALWDPAIAAKAMNQIAVMILDGKAIKNGDNLGLTGYETLRQDENDPKLFYGEAGLFLNKEDALNYDF